MASPAVEAALKDWERGFTPSEWAQQHFRANYRMELEAALARLIMIIDRAGNDGDELRILPSVESFAAYAARLDTRLRCDLAGDRLQRTEESHTNQKGAAA